MRKYIIRRLLMLLPVLLGITFLTFAMMHLAGSDVVQQKMDASGVMLSSRVLQARREELGLDQPFLIQYLCWLKGFVTGDPGTSYTSGMNVGELFLSKLPATLFLALLSVILTTAVSVPLGIIAAVCRRRAVKLLISGFCFVGNSLPGFAAALLLLYFFSVRLSWFPVISQGTGLRSGFLPACTLAFAMSSRYIRQIRAAVMEELEKPYVTAARIRGIRFRQVLFHSAVPSALTAVLPLFSVSLGSLLGGTAVTESVFLWDGVGKMAVDAISMRDYPVIQAYVVWMAVIYAAVNLASDLLYGILDPRIGRGGQENE